MSCTTDKVNSPLNDEIFEQQIKWAREHPTAATSELKKPRDLLREVAVNWTRTQHTDYKFLLDHLREINGELDDALRYNELKLIADAEWNSYLRRVKAETVRQT